MRTTFFIRPHATVLLLAAMLFSARNVLSQNKGHQKGNPRETTARISARNSEKVHTNNSVVSQQLLPNEALDVLVNVQFEDTPLSKALETLAKEANTKIVLDPAAIREYEINAKDPISLNVRQARLETVLRLILRQVKTEFVIVDDILLITNHEGAGELVTKTYRVADLVVATDRDLRPRILEQELVDLIIQTVQGDSWQDNGGDGTVEFHELTLSLVISNDRTTHRRVEQLLTDLCTIKNNAKLEPSSQIHEIALAQRLSDEQRSSSFVDGYYNPSMHFSHSNHGLKEIWSRAEAAQEEAAKNLLKVEDLREESAQRKAEHAAWEAHAQTLRNAIEKLRTDKEATRQRLRAEGTQKRAEATKKELVSHQAKQRLNIATLQHQRALTEAARADAEAAQKELERLRQLLAPLAATSP